MKLKINEGKKKRKRESCGETIAKFKRKTKDQSDILQKKNT